MFCEAPDVYLQSGGDLNMRKAFILILLLSCSFASAAEQLHPKLEVQIWLDRNNFSPGEIDGTIGKNTQKALAAFQESHQIPGSVTADEKTMQALREEGVEPITTYTITQADVKGPFVEKIPSDFMEQAKLKSLSYTSGMEALSEKFHVSSEILKKLNPNSDFSAGSEIQVPNVLVEKKQSDQKKVQPVAAKKQKTANTTNTVVLSKDNQQLIVKDGDGNTIFFAPITAGSDQYPYPVGEWKVKGVSKNPAFDYSPEFFKDAKATHTKAKLPPGPNNPVGTVWIDISAPHYGLHGTAEPGKIGYSESHGCIRLTNWDVEKLASLVKVGTPVIFE
jgi:lipoprotein-anchoring transpeptidase ErfK/SrfK